MEKRKSPRRLEITRKVLSGSLGDERKGGGAEVRISDGEEQLARAAPAGGKGGAV